MPGIDEEKEKKSLRKCDIGRLSSSGHSGGQELQLLTLVIFSFDSRHASRFAARQPQL